MADSVISLEAIWEGPNPDAGSPQDVHWCGLRLLWTLQDNSSTEHRLDAGRWGIPDVVARELVHRVGRGSGPGPAQVPAIPAGGMASEAELKRDSARRRRALASARSFVAHLQWYSRGDNHQANALRIQAEIDVARFLMGESGTMAGPAGWSDREVRDFLRTLRPDEEKR